ncbi:hypothetical protein, partial [Sphingomonas sp. CCH5-D11]|uniref:hypothetical protein n=1 Tax=Sphingomonas sp. CCH5-D11 TaxID=1768786 RepID=UPI000A8FECE3
MTGWVGQCLFPFALSVSKPVLSFAEGGRVTGAGAWGTCFDKLSTNGVGGSFTFCSQVARLI